MNVIYLDQISRNDVRNNRDLLFVFGDNCHHYGYGGQATEMRGEPNACGIRVKKLPSMSTASFYTDDEYQKNCENLSNDINEMLRKLQWKSGLVFPSAGIGTGFAQLAFRAPRTAKFLEELLMKNGIKNGVKP